MAHHKRLTTAPGDPGRKPNSMDAVLKSILFPAVAMLAALIALFIVLTVGYKVLRVRADAIPASLVTDPNLLRGQWRVEVYISPCDAHHNLQFTFHKDGSGPVFVECDPLPAKGGH